MTKMPSSLKQLGGIFLTYKVPKMPSVILLIDQNAQVENLAHDRYASGLFK